MLSATSNLDVNNSLSQGHTTLLGFLFIIKIIMIITKIATITYIVLLNTMFDISFSFLYIPSLIWLFFGVTT